MPDARLARFELFVATATVAAHASHPSGFRQRDVRFLIELFSNWVECSLEDHVLPVQNNQVARYLTQLATEGFARKISRKGAPAYRLTRIGLIELMTRSVNRHYFTAPAHFFFLYYFLSNYQQRLEELIQAEGQQFPPALRLELAALLDTKNLVQRELKMAQEVLLRLDNRIEDASRTSALMLRSGKQGTPFEDAVLEAQRLYPYELNSQKPLSELMADIPAVWRSWELSTGNIRRIEQIWQPARSMLQSYIRELERLA